MARPIEEDTNIGKRIGRLLQQYALRIVYAEGKVHLYDEESNNASARGSGVKTLKATITRNCWEVYAKNLTTKKGELEQAVKEALIGYNEIQKKVWFAYFIEDKSSDEIKDEMNLTFRTTQRMVSAMKEDMNLKFDLKLPKMGESEPPKFSPKDLAEYLTDKPSEDYISAVKDLLEYGIVDLDELDFDPDFQDFLNPEGMGNG